MPVILIAVFIDLIGFGLIVPILPFLTLKYGGTALTGVGLISIYALMSFLAGPLWGRLSDRIGRRPTLILTFAGAACSYVVLANADSLIMLYIARALSGAMAGNVGIVMAAVADLTTAENRGRALGYVGAVFGLGFAVGPGLGGILGSIGGEVSIYYPGIAAVFLSSSAMLLAYFFMPETNIHKTEITGYSDSASKRQSWTSILGDTRKKLLFTMFVIIAAGQSITFSITPFWLGAVLDWNQKEVGYLLMLGGLAVAFVQSIVVGPLFKAIGEEKALMVGASLCITGCLVLIMSPPSIIIAVCAFPIIMSGTTLAFPAMNSIISNRTDQQTQGAALGLSNGLSSLGRVIGPLSAGVLFTPAAPDSPFIVVAFVGGVCILWSLFELRAQSRP
ncbi:tetracycline resistance MFS efflux pump [Kordiimonas sediminis]|uniref:Tetracycline resistance MFS efflux pump n=1 Tax=Kordiimonas sediminis TaxID=1735581 RepID=A0A919AKE7_9PROT|nr:MFS transporter [Kordiimonas sediminis]GHF11815.1 tetracycline resistance MFS efflux pump [Kordiimonas sediminis]